MKFLKYTLLLVLALILVGLLYVAMFPSNYDVSRSKLIKQPITKVFNTVNDLRTWEKWGPWHDEDSTIVVTYGKTTTGVGASNSWTSKDGSGSMKTIAVKANKSIRQEMRFGDYEPSDIIWNFEEVGGDTKVTWRMKEDEAPFIFKFFSAMSGGWDEMLGPMLDNGLKNLDRVVKDMPNPYRLSATQIVKTTDKVFFGYPYTTKIDQAEIQKVFTENMIKISSLTEKLGLTNDDFIPAALYQKWDEAAGETKFHIGFFLTKELAIPEGMEKINVKGGKYAMLSKFGDYGKGDYEAHLAVGEYLKINELETTFPLYELYVNDASKVKIEDIQTDIYYPIK